MISVPPVTDLIPIGLTWLDFFAGTPTVLSFFFSVCCLLTSTNCFRLLVRCCEFRSTRAM